MQTERQNEAERGILEKDKEEKSLRHVDEVEAKEKNREKKYTERLKAMRCYY